jgi:hypothetical protein
MKPTLALCLALAACSGSGGDRDDEADPIFGASPAAGISSDEVDTWNTAASWGNHQTAGYITAEGDPKIDSTADGSWCVGTGTQISCNAPPPLTAETDPTFAGSTAAGITATDTQNWDDAHAWGDHATAGYLTAETDPQIGAVGNGLMCVGNGTQVNCAQPVPTDTNAETLCADGQYLNGDGNCYRTLPQRVAGVLSPGQTVRFNNQFDRGISFSLFFGHLNFGGSFSEMRGAGQNGNSIVSGFALTSGTPATVESFVLSTGGQSFAVTKTHGRVRGGNDGSGPSSGSFVLENNDTTNINYVLLLGPSDDHPF